MFKKEQKGSSSQNNSLDCLIAEAWNDDLTDEESEVEKDAPKIVSSRYKIIRGNHILLEEYNRINQEFWGCRKRQIRLNGFSFSKNGGVPKRLG